MGDSCTQIIVTGAQTAASADDLSTVRCQRPSVSAVGSMNRSQISILFLIRDLNVGGAERQLTELVRGLVGTCFTITVATLYDDAELAAEIQKSRDVQVISLRKKG